MSVYDTLQVATRAYGVHTTDTLILALQYSGPTNFTVWIIIEDFKPKLNQNNIFIFCSSDVQSILTPVWMDKHVLHLFKAAASSCKKYFHDKQMATCTKRLRKYLVTVSINHTWPGRLMWHYKCVILKESAPYIKSLLKLTPTLSSHLTIPSRNIKPRLLHVLHALTRTM